MYAIRSYYDLWIKNTIKNLKDLKYAKPFEMLKTDKPVVVVGAGESIESVIINLQRLRNSLFILCVDTALHRITSYNVCYTKLLREVQIGRMQMEGVPFLPVTSCAKIKGLKTRHDNPASKHSLVGQVLMNISNPPVCECTAG